MTEAPATTRPVRVHVVAGAPLFRELSQNPLLNSSQDELTTPSRIGPTCQLRATTPLAAGVER